MNSAEPRANAAQALFTICEEGRTTDWLVKNKPYLLEHPLTSEMVYGSLRHYHKLSKAVDNFLVKPLRKKDRILFYLLLVGAYQLVFMRVKAHAAINETVSSCKTVSRPWAKGLVNAVLHRISDLKTKQSFGNTQEIPTWLQAKMPADCDLAALETRAPMTLRINQKRVSPERYKQTLSAQGMEFETTPLQESVILANAISSASLPGWANGDVAVQDLGAQFAARLAVAPKPKRILDACAAPGGKLFHLMEHLPDAEYLALERSEPRIETTKHIAERLGHNIDLRLADATELEWWDGKPFDLVLLDAPCSGIGTLRRHPEIKLHLQPADIQAHADTQLQLLHNLWPTLAPGGTLLYCTCSMLSAENDQVIEAFLTELGGGSTDVSSPTAIPKANPMANLMHRSMTADNSPRRTNQIVIDPIELPLGRPTRYGWQLCPPETDGFYYAKLRRVA